MIDPGNVFYRSIELIDVDWCRRVSNDETCMDKAQLYLCTVEELRQPKENDERLGIAATWETDRSSVAAKVENPSRGNTQTDTGVRRELERKPLSPESKR